MTDPRKDSQDKQADDELAVEDVADLDATDDESVKGGAVATRQTQCSVPSDCCVG